MLDRMLTQKQVSCAELARRVGVAPSTVHAWRTAGVRVGRIPRVAQALGLSVAEETRLFVWSITLDVARCERSKVTAHQEDK